MNDGMDEAVVSSNVHPCHGPHPSCHNVCATDAIIFILLSFPGYATAPLLALCAYLLDVYAHRDLRELAKKKAIDIGEQWEC